MMYLAYTKADYLSDLIGALQPIRTAIEALAPFFYSREVENTSCTLMDSYAKLQNEIAWVREHPCGLHDNWNVVMPRSNVYAWLDKHPAPPQVSK